ncbi:50S ribosomal protein L9 [Neomoorella thermoacetica]|uniref:Large ribosomal subunit protein bL9 n=1 Tax=Moorella thermoacetica (strain ATCC 39073 / JCM 9320) TaxID=264732 RepID=RL9_MOOTA|nr:50S ribosomal protein L9 [Moorella thermoacetica]Q2RM68.1 RecName: Full=Large ribosomal subunit protein bL9; AltName: Full=50S ribosomal protein L9 [Moorella thermoacetica ATCC 39073]AKX92961.1 50S ribosomal protein L9 [Moorella thermoacetica]AKX95514.1 50S ribosomal protein L9 [Moorella thermoacetica]APC07322.1 50S ribosomal protein L9 [Moorella thermoacetica]OIQ52835.1 50S ribosomal protein L9 [Moorella thermoacetica]OIQ56970.1 50S ribosomal protein L9 [Moorella thermoacetica]
MKVILTADVAKLGNRGTLVEVSEGYARNYLLPRGLAVEATAGRLKELDLEKKRREKKENQELENARRQAARLDGAVVKITTRAGETGKLFGSVTNKEIAEAIKNTFQISLDRRKIDLKEPIKALGSYEVTLKLHPTVQAHLRVQVVAEGS